MSRGRKAQDGNTFINKNGYHHTRVNGRWELTGRIVAEKKLGRELRPGERIRFIDGNRSNLAPSNVKVTIQKAKSKEAQRAALEHQIEELQQRLESLG